MKLKLNNVTISFPTLFQPRSVMDSKPKYSASFIYAKDSAAAKAAMAAMQEAAVDKWDKKGEAVLRGIIAAGRACQGDGDAKEDRAGYLGNYYLNASNAARPHVVHRDGATPITEDDGIIYAGAVVDAVVDVYAQDNQYGRRINAVLLGVRFVSDGPRLTAGAILTEEDFPPLPPVESADDAEGLL